MSGRTRTSDPLTKQHRIRFEHELVFAARSVCKWWGATFAGTFRIELDDSIGPSMALTPAWRGNQGLMLFRSGAIRGRRAADIHEMAHVFAPNANRFLAEGVAVYAHQHLRGRPAYPNLGGDLHRLAKGLHERADLSALDRVATPNRLWLPKRLCERKAYIVAGSFVRFLIERFGMGKFRELYGLTPLIAGRRDAGGPGRWRSIFRTDLYELESEWKRAISAYRSAATTKSASASLRGIDGCEL